jgi:hypothetical protein
VKTVFLRVIDAEDKAAALLEASRERMPSRRFTVDPAQFAVVPRSPFAYWVGESLIRLFASLPAFESDGRTAKQGLATADDFRFQRAWWEVSLHTGPSRWHPIVRGGRFSRFYADVVAVVNWWQDGAEPKAWAGSLYGNSHWSRILKNTHLFFRPGITWPLRGVRFSAQAVPSGCVFSVGGKMAFVPAEELPFFLVLFNSRAFDAFIAFFAGKVGGVQYEVGLIQSIPVPRASAGAREACAAAAKRAWSLECRLDAANENAHAFSLPALREVVGPSFHACAGAWCLRLIEADRELAMIQADTDDLCFDLYGIDEADRKALTEGFGAAGPAGGTDADAGEAEPRGDDVEADDDGDASVDAANLAAELASWAVGVTFGRFDVRLATGERPMPPEPEPFDPLPACSPGMLTGDDGLPLARPSAGYPLDFPESGVIVDDPGHLRDVTAAARRVFDVVFGADADRWWSDVSAAIEPKRADMRGWLAGSFFEYHLKRYSKSRRKAPIYWQLATPSASYSVWLYAHRVTRDTFFQLQNDIVGPKLLHEEQRLAGLIERGGATPSAAVRKEISAQEAFVEELRAMVDEVKRVAPLWNPDLDDGIVLVMAPLWRLVPQHKAWQKELKSRWDELVEGKYDWAHLAMHLWPERVVPKCATDRSLAIAHGLEDEFWVEGADGKWKARTTPTRPVEELVRERSSPAVKAALKALLEAPAPAGSARRAGAGRRGARA